jgi:phosphoserine phosphatase RsbX
VHLRHLEHRSPVSAYARPRHGKSSGNGLEEAHRWLDFPLEPAKWEPQYRPTAPPARSRGGCALQRAGPSFGAHAWTRQEIRGGNVQQPKVHPLSQSDLTHPLDWALLVKQKEGESLCGDSACVQLADNRALIAVVDGLGHGPPAAAAAAAELAMAVFHDRPAGEPTELMRRCHDALLGSRGAAMTVARIEWQSDKLTWIAVGNVAGSAVQPDAKGHLRRVAVVPRSGIVGMQLPTLQPTTIQLQPGDLLVFATDGINPQFTHDLPFIGTPQSIAQRVFDRWRTPADDALVLVARYQGAPR